MSPTVREVYKRLWFDARDTDQQEKLEYWATKGWFLCAIEPTERDGCTGAIYWLHRPTGPRFVVEPDGRIRSVER